MSTRARQERGLWYVIESRDGRRTKRSFGGGPEAEAMAEEAAAEINLERTKERMGILVPERIIPDEANCDRHLNPSNIGARHELIVCADLMRQGYEVFRPMNPGCSYDLIAIKDGKSLRLEVRTALHSPSGRLIYRHPKSGCADVVALVFYTWRILYIPDLA